MSTKFTSENIVARIRSRFSDSSQHCVVEQLANSTGHKCDSWIDIAVIGLWPSTGLNIDAYEVKVSRSDFTRELADPDKNQWCRDELSSFSYVVAPGVYKPDEDVLPAGAGMFEAVGESSYRCLREPIITRRKVYSANLTAAIARAMQKHWTAFAQSQVTAAVESDYRYVQALEVKQVVEQFLENRLGSGHATHSASNLLEALQQATTDAKQAHALKEIEQALSAYQYSFSNMMERMAAVASLSLDIHKPFERTLARFGQELPDMVKRVTAKRQKDDADRQKTFEAFLVAMKPGEAECCPADLTNDFEALEIKTVDAKPRPDRQRRQKGKRPAVKEPTDVAPATVSPWNRGEIAVSSAVTTKPLLTSSAPGACQGCGGNPADCTCPPCTN